ncbi:MAG TPA: hypothetical protein VMN57_11435, partial [Anaerolineales bacterium]|nr:hypothetical protein [Anaerolineales bacterium]
NVTGVPRFAILNRAIAGLRYPLRKYNPPRLLRFLRRTGLARLQERIRLANTRPMGARPEMAPETRALLRDYFRDDVEALQETAGRDLAAWLK